METYSTAKGRIVIPAALRRKYGIKQGTKIIITDNDGSITLTPVTEAYLEDLQGSLKGSGALKMLAEERKQDSYKGK